MSAPLDEIALQHFRDSVSGSSLSSDDQTSATDEIKLRQLSRDHCSAAHRIASKSKAILSAQMNSLRGVDVFSRKTRDPQLQLQPGPCMLGRFDVDRMQDAELQPSIKYKFWRRFN
ncbi:hypothetical protein CY34DRAFT_19563 [Suillus luteus UH-Slu-Lm8-n1]|uniref:Uncharacterized protein n=1 Tax=Suillus luteus UH-Slu-Lm8-n1 TaxID=930992 RepID=A0A0D0AC17_9AGAM|nr:hypothetical protein CY34DRAFT_19563 [Suillus luteus UH-Slu-Lm8-n1]